MNLKKLGGPGGRISSPIITRTVAIASLALLLVAVACSGGGAKITSAIPSGVDSVLVMSSEGAGASLMHTAWDFTDQDLLGELNLRQSDVSQFVLATASDGPVALLYGEFSEDDIGDAARRDLGFKNNPVSGGIVWVGEWFGNLTAVGLSEDSTLVVVGFEDDVEDLLENYSAAVFFSDQDIRDLSDAIGSGSIEALSKACLIDRCRASGFSAQEADGNLRVTIGFKFNSAGEAEQRAGDIQALIELVLGRRLDQSEVTGDIVRVTAELRDEDELLPLAGTMGVTWWQSDGVIAVGQTVYGRLLQADTEYALDLEARQSVRISAIALDEDLLDPEIAIIDSSGREINRNDDGFRSGNGALLEITRIEDGGTHTVAVISGSGSGAYIISIEIPEDELLAALPALASEPDNPPPPAATPSPAATPAPAATATAAPTATSAPATPAQTLNSADRRDPDDSAAGTAESGPKQGGVFNTLWSDPPTLDPHLVTDGTSHGIVIEVFSGLVRLGPNTSAPFEPDLAESWSISNGGTVYEFKLRSDLVFSNGDPVTAQDFKWSFERAASPDTGSTIVEEILGDIVGIQDIVDGNATTASGIEVIDERILRITIDAPKAYFIAKLTYPTAFVLNRENVESLGSRWTDDPVSTGPFKLQEYRVGERIRLTRNDNYWDRTAYLDEIVFNLAGGVAMAMYENDEIDTTGIGLADLERVQDPTEEISKDLVDVPPGFSVSYVGFNLNKAPFDDPAFRQALNHAVDKQLMAEQVFSNLVRPAYGIIPPGFPGYSPDIRGLEFDLQLAKDLLAQSAYADPETRPRIVLTVPGTGGSPGLTTLIVVDMWRQNLGIEIEIQQVEWATYIDDLHLGRLQVWSGLSWQADYPDPQSFLDVLFRSDSAINYGGYANSRVDEFLILAQTERDAVKRIAFYNDAEQIIVSDAPWLPLWWGVNSKALVKPWVKGYAFSSLTIAKFKDVWIDR